MRNFKENRRNKKGFTLAELLIVVAIIAILVAIAVPLFVSSLDKANKAAKDANIRAVKAVAMAEILDKWEEKGTGTSGHNYGYIGENLSSGLASEWKVAATIDENGGITINTITPKAALTSHTDESYTRAKSGKVKITTYITDVKTPS